MDTSARRRSGWIALAVSSLARMLLGVLASLLLWAVTPALAGLHPTVVMTGSMLPRLVPGDVVFSRSVPAADLQLGQTLLYPDPDRPGHLRMHRWIGVTADGLLITKGDANPERDSTPIDRSSVVGVASLRVPFVARPVVWAADGAVLPLALTGAALLATLVAAFWFRAAVDPVAEDDGAPSDDDGLTSSPEQSTGDHTPRRPRRLVQAGATLLLVVGLGGTFASSADAATAKFTRSTANPTSTWNAATYFSCNAAARALGARFAWPLGETGGSTANDVTANNVDGTYRGGVTYGVAGPCRTDGTSGVTLDGTSGNVSSSLTADSIPELTLQTWFRAASTSRGGTLMSFTSTSGGLFSTDTTSMAVGMTTTGTLSFAVTSSGTKRVTGTVNYRDNAWHQMTAVAGAGGMVLYVDGAAVGSVAGAVPTTAVTGTPRVGYGDASDLSTGTSDYFQGSVAYAAVYKSSLSSASVLAAFQAATPS